MISSCCFKSAQIYHINSFINPLPHISLSHSLPLCSTTLHLLCLSLIQTVSLAPMLRPCGNRLKRRPPPLPHCTRTACLLVNWPTNRANWWASANVPAKSSLGWRNEVDAIYVATTSWPCWWVTRYTVHTLVMFAGARCHGCRFAHGSCVSLVGHLI